MMKYSGLEIVSDALCIVGESPVWNSADGMLYYVDIQGKRIRKLDYSNGKTEDIVLSQQTGCIIPDENGGIIGGMEDGVYQVLPNGDTFKINKPFDMKGFRFNDGKAGPDGKLYIGTISRERQGALYCMDSDGNMNELLNGIGNSNGLDWDIEKNLMYFNDTPTFKTDVFDFESGKISNRRNIFEYKSTQNPDGMTMDEDGMLWVCLWGEGKVVRLNPDTKEITDTVLLPVPNAACCIFGGDNLNELIITTASHFTDLRVYPLAGSVFKIKLPYKGRLPYKFRGGYAK